MRKAELSENFGDMRVGDVYLQKNLPERIYIRCPVHGETAMLKIPPFTFDAATITIGPASLRLPCGFHGYLKNGEWEKAGDSV